MADVQSKPPPPPGALAIVVGGCASAAPSPSVAQQMRDVEHRLWLLENAQLSPELEVERVLLQDNMTPRPAPGPGPGTGCLHPGDIAVPCFSDNTAWHAHAHARIHLTCSTRASY